MATVELSVVKPNKISLDFLTVRVGGIGLTKDGTFPIAK